VFRARPAEDFFEVVRRAAVKSGRKFIGTENPAASAGSSGHLQGRGISEGDLFEICDVAAAWAGSD
jgi:hypothetical protein